MHAIVTASLLRFMLACLLREVRLHYCSSQISPTLGHSQPTSTLPHHEHLKLTPILSSMFCSIYLKAPLDLVYMI
jgi:hypothetical protein